MNPQFNPTATAPTNGVYSAKQLPQSATIPVTPDDAKEWLKRSEGNRRIDDKMVQLYVEDINEGNFEISGNCICFDLDGVLIDGHHRLTAISRAGKTVHAMVGWGFAKRVRYITDTGKIRSGSDMMAIDGYARSTFWPAVARHVLNYDRGTKVSSKMQTHKIHEYAKQYLDSKSTPKHEFDKICKTPSAISAAKHLLLRYQNAEQVQHFFEVLSNGITQRAEDEVIQLYREALRNVKTEPLHGHHRALRYLHVTIKVYSIWLKGRTTNKFGLSSKIGKNAIDLYSAKTLRRVERTEP
jgi:hypothetical protein